MLAMLKAFTALVGLSLCLATGARAEAPERNRMTECTREASRLPVADRQAFMDACLAGHDPRVIRLSPQERMKECTRRAEGKTGEARRTFMNSCLRH